MILKDFLSMFSSESSVNVVCLRVSNLVYYDDASHMLSSAEYSDYLSVPVFSFCVTPLPCFESELFSRHSCLTVNL